MLWRFDHFPAENVVTSADGTYIAQERTLPEGSVRPYGQGVFIRHRFNPFWASSKLVFAGYCKPDMRLTWTKPSQLTIGCIVSEGTVVQFSAPEGVTVALGGDA